MASFITGRGLRLLRRPAASTRPSAESRLSVSTSWGLTPCFSYASTTWSKSPDGSTFSRRSMSSRSMISATAMTEASSNGQTGQPAALMMSNNALPPRDAKRGM